MSTPLERYDACIELQRSGDPAAAVEGLRKITEEFPDFALAYNALGAFYKKQGDLETAIACAEKYTELEPDDAFGFTILSSFCVEAGQREKAEDALGKAQDLQFRARFEQQ